MFNYKTWKLYYPSHQDIPKDPDEPSIVVDGNGNSITPDSLKKNMTIPAEAPSNDLAKMLANMLGADPANKVEAASELIKYLEPISKLAIPDYSEALAGVFIINATRGVFDNPTSYNDILSAISAGKIVMLQNVKTEGVKMLTLQTIFAGGELDAYFEVTFCGDCIFRAENADDPLEVFAG